MNNKDDEIQRKLQELEATVLKETPAPQAVTSASQHQPTVVGSSAPGSTTLQQDLYYFLGLGLILTGVLMFFNHVHVGTGFLQALGWGGGGFGLILIPLIFGLGWLMYDSKSKVAWLLTAVVCGVIIFSVLSSLIMTFPTSTLLGVIILLLPFAAGGALLLKGAGGPKGLENKLK